MPIGSSKIGVLGAGLVPGGSVTFNAPGTWAIPPGVKKVSITGKGGTGNPGVAGNPGNPGNPGSGGSGGGASISREPATQPTSTTRLGSKGGTAFTLNGGVANGQPGSPYNNCSKYIFGGSGGLGIPTPSGQPGSQGQSGNAGSTGQAGNAGTIGQSSSALCNTFLGGAGGNAPPGGNAGNAGTGGNAGGAGIGPTFSGGAGGNGGGSGASGGNYGPSGNIPLAPGPSPTNVRIAILGGGGAGVVNDGQSGPNNNLCGRVWNVAVPSPPSLCAGVPGASYAKAGGTGNPQVTSPLPLPNGPSFIISTPNLGIGPVVNPALNSMQGGLGVAPRGGSCGQIAGSAGWVWKAESQPIPTWNASSRTHLNGPSSSFNNACLRQEVLRAGGGGGGLGADVPRTSPNTVSFGGAGGGGGRGNAGNAGGPSPTISGSAANPATFNCVPVTPGGTAPITVGTPGGQIVISWNPQ